MWNWQQKDWPYFRYESKELENLEKEFLIKSGENLGLLKHISQEEKDLLKIELLSEEALKTSKIEGDILDRDSLQSSLCRLFGIKTDGRHIPPVEQGIAEMMMDLYKNWEAPLSHQILWHWHEMLMTGRRDLKDIGSYRTDKEPMQVVSGAIYAPKIHFEAPPFHLMMKEMDDFIHWFNLSSIPGTSQLPALTRSGISHLYFVSVHPFEDGNGRIGRALAEKSLAKA